MHNWQNTPTIRELPDTRSCETYKNSSLERATNILLCLNNGINTNTEIAKRCRYSTSTVHRLLHVLKNLGWVIQDNINHRYYPGSIINQLSANQSSAHRYLLINAVQEMGHLSVISGETINLSVMVQLRSILLHSIPSEQELRVTETDSGYGSLFAVGATGKALLSQLSDDEIREVLYRVDLKKVSKNIVTDRRELITQLYDIRRQGYAISYGERIPGAMCVSAVIKNYTYPVALSVLGLESRIKPRVREITEALLAGAGRISQVIGNIHRSPVA